MVDRGRGRLGRRARGALVVTVTAVALAGAGAPTASAAVRDDVLDEAWRAARLLTPPRELGLPRDAYVEVVSDGGVVVAASGGGSGFPRYRWDAARGVVRMPDGLYPQDVNDRGLVVGHTWEYRRAVAWQQGGDLVDLAPQAADGSVDAGSVNNHGLVSATIHDNVSVRGAALLRDGQIERLPLAGNSYGSDRHLLNDRGELASVRRDATGPGEAFVWRAGTVRVLANPDAGAYPSVARINARGDVLGRLHAPVVWRADGSLQRLDTGVSGTARPIDMNDSGVVVGNASPHGAPQRPVTWDHRGLTVLPIAGHAGGGAHAIGNQGVVAGWLRPHGADRVPAVWVRGVPVPLGMDLPGRRGTGGQAQHVTDDGRVIGFVQHDGGSDTVVWDLRPGR